MRVTLRGPARKIQLGSAFPPGTIRADFAESIDANAVHGSDGPETAAVEIAYFFPALAVYAR